MLFAPSADNIPAIALTERFWNVVLLTYTWKSEAQTVMLSVDHHRLTLLLNPLAFDGRNEVGFGEVVLKVHARSALPLHLLSAFLDDAGIQYSLRDLIPSLA